MADVVRTNMLDARYRCDKCGSQAYVLTALNFDATLGKPDELYWCAHHYNEVRANLEPLCGLIVDETHRLIEHVKDDGHVN